MQLTDNKLELKPIVKLENIKTEIKSEFWPVGFSKLRNQGSAKYNRAFKISNCSVVCAERASTTTTILKCIFQSTQQIWKSIALSVAEDLLQNIPLHVMLLFIRIYDLIVRNALSITTLKKNLLDTGVDYMVQDIQHSVENSLTSGLEGIKNTKQNARNAVFKRNLNKRKNFLAGTELTKITVFVLYTNCIVLFLRCNCN